VAERNVTYADFDLYTRSETTVDASLKHAALDAATVAVDNALARKMIVATGATARVYCPDCNSQNLWLHDFTTLTSIVENGTTLTNNTDFVLRPLNGLSDAEESVPYNQAVRYGTTWYTDGPKATITVTAAWGWAAIPPQVIEMTKLVGKAMLESRNFSLGVVALTETGAFGARETKVVRDTIDAYRSYRSLGI
jgi:hypothetical protein